jgi:hypothetical protein
MKLTPADYDRYYESLGIKASDLFSSQDVSFDELPADMALTNDERDRMGRLVRQWNSADARAKVDMAQAMERGALKTRRTPRETQVDASLAYLMLARLRGCEERRELVRRIAIGEVNPPVPKTPKRERKAPRAPSFREQVDARLRAKGLEVFVEKTQETTPDGDTVTIHHIKMRPIRSRARGAKS